MHSEMVDVLNKVTPVMMKDAQQEEDIDISKTICYVKSCKKPMLSQIRKIKSRPMQRYLHQFDRLVFRQGVLHRVYEQDGAKYHQHILPIEFRAQAMELLHNQQGHCGSICICKLAHLPMTQFWCTDSTFRQMALTCTNEVEAVPYLQVGFTL